MATTRFPKPLDKSEHPSRRLVLLGFLQGLAAGPALAQLGAPPMLQTNSSQFIELRPAMMMPVVTLQRIDGKMTPLNASPGKVLLLCFWGTWCPPCRRELPALERAQKSFDSTKFEIAAVSVDTVGKATIDGFLNRLGVKNLQIFLDPAGRIAERANRETGAPFPLYGMPITYVIDRNGMVRGYITGEVDWLSSDATAFLGYFIDS
jgi:thiol-disulfide isomerase/thioredoxin